MEDVSKFKVGDKVNYNPFRIEGVNDKENDVHGVNGIVKKHHDSLTDSIFVVYHCGGEWDNYKYYTAALTKVNQLEKGWV